MDVKLIFYGVKIENAYISRCVLKERMLQSCRYTIDIHKTLMCVYHVQLTIRIGGGDRNIAIPHRKFWRGDVSPPSPHG